MHFNFSWNKINWIILDNFFIYIFVERWCLKSFKTNYKIIFKILIKTFCEKWIKKSNDLGGKEDLEQKLQEEF